MSATRKWAPGGVVALLMVPLTALCAAEAQQAIGVAVGADGKLCYACTGSGDRIVDFSHAGYGGGGVRLPVVPVCKEVAPSGGDDSAAMQAALDAVGALPLKDGVRGTVLLRPGTFRCAQPLTLAHDGVVLRGSGAGKEGTVIEMTGAAHICVSIAGERLRFPKEISAAGMPITDAYVPAGATSFSVKDARGLAAGDEILIRRLATAQWIRFMGMDKLVRNGQPQTWMKNDSPLTVERSIRAVQGQRITLDVPLTDALDAHFLAPGSAVVVKTTRPKRLTHCGLESLRIVSPPPSGTLTEHNNDA
ncbi:MAG: hypothetical protein NTY53_10265, partial [Kiritimatiellaeota bacterium]|nr:hypothetical protein [Kiritimatiellota bacterium]